MDWMKVYGRVLTLSALFCGVLATNAEAITKNTTKHSYSARVYSLLGQEILKLSEKNMSYAEAIKLCTQKLSEGSYVVHISVAGITKTMPLNISK